jgi:hypothetical protein
VGEVSDLLEEFDGDFEPDISFVEPTPRYLAGRRAADIDSKARIRAALTVHDGIFRRLPLPHNTRSESK